MLSIEINKTQLANLVNAAHKAKKKFRIELASAINQLAKKTRLEMGRQIRATVAINKAASEKPIRVTTDATTENLTAVVSLKRTPRPGLNAFGARQDKRGVTYKINKTGGRKRIDGAFQGPKPGVRKVSWRGNVFKRVGKAKLPIVKLKGVSPYGTYVRNNMIGPHAKAIEAELVKQIDRRINLNVLRASGLVKT